MLTSFKRIVWLASIAIAVAGCATVGADFVAPPGPDQGAAFRHSKPVGAAGLPAQWWHVFDDATLNRLEASALRDNPSIEAAAQRLLQARAQAGVVRANEAPTVAAGASLANTRTSATSSQGRALGGRSISGDAFSAGVSMAYELDLWGRMRRVAEASDAHVLVAEADRQGVLLLLSSQVATVYWQLRGLDREMAILNGALDSRRETEQLLDARFNAGLSGELDIARTRIERANAETDLHDVVRRRTLLEHSLASLIGAAPSGMLLAANGSNLPPPPAIPAGLPASLLVQRPDLGASVALLRAANAQIGVAEGAFYPSLQLTGNFGYASESLRDLAQGASRQFSIGPLALSLPIFDGGRNRANLTLSKARYNEALANHETKLLTALREVEDALSDLEQRQQQAKVQDQARQAAARAHLVAQARYERGLSNYLEVTDAQRSALAADRAAVQISTERLLATVALARALGAGWPAR